MSGPPQLLIVAPREQAETLARAAERVGLVATTRERVSADRLPSSLDAAIISAKSADGAARLARGLRAQTGRRELIVIALGVEDAPVGRELDAAEPGPLDADRTIAKLQTLLAAGRRAPTGSRPPWARSAPPATAVIDSAIDEQLESLLATVSPAPQARSVDVALEMLSEDLPVWRGPTQLLPRGKAGEGAQRRSSTLVGASETFTSRVSRLVTAAEQRLFPGAAPQGFQPAAPESIDEQLDELAADLDSFMWSDAPRDASATFDEDEGPHAPLRSLAPEVLPPLAAAPPGGEDTVVGHRRPAREPTVVTPSESTLGPGCAAADVLVRLARDGFTGRCRFQHDAAEHAIFFEAGRPVALARNHEGRRFADVFAWSEGSYDVEVGTSAPATASPCLPHVAGMLLDGARYSVTAPQLEARVGGEGAVLRRVAADLPELTDLLEPAERRAIELLDGQRGLDGVGRGSGLDVERARRLAYALVALGLFAVSGPPEAGSAGRVGLDRERVLALFALCQEGDYLAILGIGENASDHDILAAYEGRRAELAATRLEEPLPAELALIGEVLDEAYAVLRDPGSRAAYASHLTREPS
jgi:hypothetical protein